MKPRHSPASSAADPHNATYVYCLVQSAKAPSTRGVPGSVPGAGVPRILAIDRDVWAVVADAPLERFTGETLQQELQDVEAISRHALAHASVIEFFFRRAPVIPLKLFTLFSSDEKAREHVRGRLAPLKRMFAALRGLEEWGVRIVAGEVEAESARALDSGRDYLQVKKRLHDQTVAPSRATVRAANGALKSARPNRVENPEGGIPAAGARAPVRCRRVVSGQGEKARRHGEAHSAKLGAALAAQGHRLEMSGPWPPYHFVSK